MAIQNFLSGGFYGSIGELTGRRWKNKRVVQAKFKPKNPKTPAQERQRMLFTRGSALAKIAQQVNWKAPQFENPIKTDWNQRQTIAINALKDGLSEWEALPLAPKDFKAEHIIGTCTLQEITENNVMKVVLQGTNLLASKKYACALFIESGDKKGQIIVGSTSEASTDALATSFRLPESDGIKGEEVYIKIASIDDTTTETVTLSAGILLQQETETPYVFNPSLASVTYDNAGSLKIAVKLGEEPIESYDAFTNTSIKIYDKAWTKATAVNAETLDTDNWQDIEKTFTISRTTVAKSTATVTFTCAFTDAYLYEKYAAKLDITINASNIKGENSTENSQELNLTAQAFPEYLQNEVSFADPWNLVVPQIKNKQMNGKWLMAGQAFAKNDSSENGKVIDFGSDWESYEENPEEVTRVTSQANKNYSGDSLANLYEENGWTHEINGGTIGFGISDFNIKSFQGIFETNIYLTNKKIAFAGYRVWNLSGNPVDDDTVQITFNSSNIQN